MRWKLLRRRFSISAPRMIVRSHLPWPLRWAVVAVAFGFSAALAMWAFEFGKEIAGLDRGAKEELAQLREEVATLRAEREKAVSTANTVESLLKTEKAAQDKLAQQLKQTEADNLALKNDLGFFERLFPADASEGIVVRGLQAEAVAAGQVRYQLLLMQAGKAMPEFKGRCEVTLSGLLDGKPWQTPQPGGPQALTLKQYLRVEGLLEHAPAAVVKTISVRITDAQGAVKATQTVKL